MNLKFLMLGLLLVSGLLFFGCTNSNTSSNQPVNNSQAVALFFNYFSNNIPSTYYYVYNEAINGINKTVTLAKSDNATLISLDSLPWGRQYYIFTNGSVIGCVNVHNPIYNATSFCSDISNDSKRGVYVSQDFKNIISYPFSDKKLQMDKVFYRNLYKLGVMVFQPIGTCTWNGGTYYKLQYTINYKDLTLQQLKSMHVDPSILPDQVNATYCVDKDGFRLSKSFKQIRAGILTLKVGLLVKNYSVNLPKDVFNYKYPYDASALLYKNRFGDGWKTYQIYSNVMIQGDQDKIDQSAKNLANDYSNPMFCDLLSSKNMTKICYLSMAAGTGNPRVCGVASDDIKDDCYLNVVYKQKNTTYCSDIVDSFKKNECLHMFDSTNSTNSTNIIPSNITTNNTNNTNGLNNMTIQNNTGASDVIANVTSVPPKVPGN